MNRCRHAAFVCVMGMIFISGCWNRRELNDLAVSVAIGVDKAGKQILVSDQVLNAGAISGKEGGAAPVAPVTLFQERGGGFQEAARRMTLTSTRKIYVGQIQMLIFGEDMAKEGLAKVLDHISRDHEYRKDFYVAIARGAEAQDILKVFTPIERTPATKMKSSLETSSKAFGATAAVKVDELISTIISKGKEAVLTGIKLEGSTHTGNKKENVEEIASPAELKYSGLAVFKKDKLIGWLSEEESKGFQFTQGKIKSTSLLMACPDDNNNNMTVEVLRTKNKTKAAMEGGKPVIRLEIKAEGVLTDAQCKMDLTTPASISELERMASARIRASIMAAVKTMQAQYKSDIFGFGEEMERKNPLYWERVKDDWDDVFSVMQVNVGVETKIQQMFKTTKSFSERMGE